MTVTIFHDDAVLARGTCGSFGDAVCKAARQAPTGQVLAFDDDSGKQVDLEIALAAEARKRGRPAMGVEAKEVTLLPRHWAWLAAQPGGASVTLRKLVEAACKAEPNQRDRLDAAYRFLTVMAGNRPGYEEAIRALYAGDRDRFATLAAGWPVAVTEHARDLAWPATAA
ncbi:hypothetical protein B0I00_3382 [Novosphingobium kunmingense]|uniref:DUF2239 family protein n=1 Tax=Novosphingobium kunmingense TaxID=1211806 RepID=A0A2N0H330_9SPHN|nr:DUF2239 family protein [Novosphingobium kunmingense]PKB13344.1 hypothetical protein B0I00_3382 [Novosphingobium kunmingense]